MREEDKVVMQIIAEIMEVDEADMSPDLTLYDLGADELDMVEVTLALEQAMDIEFPDSRLLINPENDSSFKVADVIRIAAEYY
ncbi:MAG: phosphopantetheine-binding protein [Proteobacteria bacterium]|nr:phosphopantetheine-binding protein [Pseudomonadota bacterium]